jgi:hypothetical protein
MPLVIVKELPAETVYEQQVVISHEPVRELLTGRHKPEIQEFVDKYLRYLKWRREDTREEIEGERLLRLSDLDQASLYGIDERMADVGREPSYQILNLIALHKTSEKLRLTFRGLNTFFIDVMEGKKKPGQEALLLFSGCHILEVYQNSLTLSSYET